MTVDEFGEFDGTTRRIFWHSPEGKDYTGYAVVTHDWANRTTDYYLDQEDDPGDFIHIASTDCPEPLAGVQEVA